jgi:hypothetical protein
MITYKCNKRKQSGGKGQSHRLGSVFYPLSREGLWLDGLRARMRVGGMWMSEGEHSWRAQVCQYQRAWDSRENGAED